LAKKCAFASLALSTFRIFSCGRCQAILMICRRCDRGQVYCADCKLAARRDMKQRARLRHSQSLEGRGDHPDHQREYRKRRSLRVMDLGSKKLAFSESVVRPDVASAPLVVIAPNTVGQKDRNETLKNDTSALSDVQTAAAMPARLPSFGHIPCVVCMVCGILGRHVREHFLQNTRFRRRVRVRPGIRAKGSAQRGQR
jgi:hypothetical protein